jgi:HEAT repeat protein
VRALIVLSGDADPTVRDWATFALGVQIERDSTEVRDALAVRLADEDVNTRDEAIRGLAVRGDTRAVEPALSADASPAIEEAIQLLADATGDPRLRERVQSS